MENRGQCFIHESTYAENVEAAASAKIFKNVHIKNTVLGESVLVGDFSRIEDTVLKDRVMIQRNNMIYTATIGRCSYTGRNTTIWHSEIGAFCSLSWNVSIGGANHDYHRMTTHSFLYSADFKLMPEDAMPYDRFSDTCVIGNDVWIAAGACICRGVTIGNGAVIGAGAVVTKDVEPYTIVAGVPAKPMKMRFKKEYAERLEKTCWWDLPFDIIKENHALFNAHPSEATLSAMEKICYDYFSQSK